MLQRFKPTYSETNQYRYHSNIIVTISFESSLDSVYASSGLLRNHRDFSINLNHDLQIQCCFPKKIEAMSALAPKYPQIEGLRNVTSNTTPLGGLVHLIDSSHYKRRGA